MKHVMVSLSIDELKLKEDQYNVKGEILLRWTSEKRKVILASTLQFTTQDMRKGIDKVNELHILNGDIFKQISIHQYE